MAAPPRERPAVFWYYSRPPPHRHRGRAEGRRAAEGRGWGRDGVFRFGTVGKAHPVRSRGRGGHRDGGGGQRGDEPGPSQHRGVRPGGPGQHPKDHPAAGAVHLRPGDGGGPPKPPEYLQHAPGGCAVQHRPVGHGRQPGHRPGGGAVVLQPLQP